MTKGFVSSMSLKYLERGIIWVLGRISFSSLKCLFSDLVYNSENTLLKAFTIRFSAMGVILCGWAISHSVRKIHRSNDWCSRMLWKNCWAVSAQDDSCRDGGKSHMVVCVGIALFWTWFCGQGSAAYKFSIVVNSRRGETILPQPCPLGSQDLCGDLPVPQLTLERISPAGKGWSANNTPDLPLESDFPDTVPARRAHHLAVFLSFVFPAG